MPLITDVYMHPDNHDGGFLANLGPPIRRYHYEGRDQFNNTLNTELQRHQNAPEEDVSEWVLFTGVDEPTFTRDFLEESTPWTIGGWSSFDASQSLLLANMPLSIPHEVAAATFNNLFLDAVEPTGLKYALSDLRSAPFKGEAKAKQPDNGWAPKRPPPGQSRGWPTLVLEVAFSQPQSKLNSDVRFWLEDDEHTTNIVLTLTINQKKPQIIIESWESQDSRAHRVQRISISKVNEQIKVEGGPLVIGFEQVFLRPATAPRERDIEFGKEKLELLATMIWDEQPQVLENQG